MELLKSTVKDVGDVCWLVTFVEPILTAQTDIERFRYRHNLQGQGDHYGMTEATASLRLSELAKPRQSAFGRGQSDTVAEIADLPKLDARTFFAETYITEAMGVLLRQVFDRLMARSDQGVFRLKQAMGGGKTHNLLAAALLAREPVDRRQYFSGSASPSMTVISGLQLSAAEKQIHPTFSGSHCSGRSAVNIDGSGQTRCPDLRPGHG
jgi:hypothetical protein